MQLTILFLILLTSAATAQIFEYSDTKGNIHYCDSPPNVLAPSKITSHQTSTKTNTYQITAVEEKSTENNKNNSNSSTISTASIKIISPTDGQIFWNARDISVRLSVSPSPQGTVVRLLLDGAQYAQLASATEFNLKDLPRGKHSLQVELLDQDKKLVKTSQVVTFYVHLATS